jgi:molecular chaperone HscB
MMENEDHFQRLGLRRRYEIDPGELDAAYERLSLANHPDFFTTASPEEQAEAQRVSARVNEAYRVLRSEFSRAAYLLGLLAEGQPLDSKALPPDFLQAMFLLQEEVDELEGGDGAERAEALREEAGSRLAALRAERQRLFAEAGNGSDAALLQAIQSNLNSERYLHRLLERLSGDSPDTEQD